MQSTLHQPKTIGSAGLTWTSSGDKSDLDQYVPGSGDYTRGNPVRYKATRFLAGALNIAQMATAEAYINGLEMPDEVFCGLTRSTYKLLYQHFPALLAPYEWVLGESDKLAESSKELMKIQYDLPQPMLNQMLGDWPIIYPKYSMGLWERGAEDLEESQIHMINQVIERLEIKDGDHILDFGCGWGCVPNYILSKFPNVRMTGVNLSHRQCEYIRGKMQDPSSYLSTGRFTLVEGDINEVQLNERFDKILTIGVFCHVTNLSEAFKKLASLLEPGGRVFIHIITARLPNNMSSGFTHKYIFPHGRYWRHDAVPSHDRDLKTVKRWYINGMNYHKTFSSWLNRFDQSQDSLRDLNYGMEYEKFRRIWRFYLMALGAAFATCDGEYNGNGQYLLTHA